MHLIGILATSVCRKWAFLFLAFFSAVSLASDCRSFYKEKETPALTNRQVLRLLMNPKHKQIDEYPVSVRTSHFMSQAHGAKSMFISETMAVKGYSRSRYDYGHFEVEIIRPIMRTKTVNTDLSPNNPQWDKILRQKEELHGSKKDSDLSIGKGRGDLIQIILEQLNFVFDRYITEKEWPPSFLRKLFYIAFNYASHSTYVVVREKGKTNQPGKILGSIRLISTPYSVRPSLLHAEIPDSRIGELAKSLLAAETNYLPGFKLHTQNTTPVSFSYNIPHWKSEVWKSIFDKDLVDIPSADVRSAPVHINENGLLSIKAPFEQVLERSYVKERLADSTHISLKDNEIGLFVEPGNFAVIPDRYLPLHLRGVASPALYFHMARLVRQEAGALGTTTRVGTYASEGSSSDRFYQMLGIGLHEKITPDQLKEGTPTTENWNVLMSDGTALTKTLKTRLRLKMSDSELNEMFRHFDEPEQEAFQKSFFRRLADSWLGIIK